MANASSTDSTVDSGSEIPARGSTRARRLTAWLLIVLASLLCFGTAADVWMKRQVLSTSQWVKASDAVLAEPKVQAALSDYIVEQIYANVDVQAEMSDLLPESLKGMSGPIAGALRAPATSAVAKIMASPQVRRLWHDVNTAAHTALVNVLEDKGTYTTSKDGKVVLDLGKVVIAVGTQLGLPAAVMDKVPADAGQITVFQSDQLALVQQAVKVVRILGPILAVVILALYAAAIWINRGRRRLTLRNVGWSIVVVGLLLASTRRLLGNVVGATISDPEYAAAGQIVFAILSRLLYDTAWMLISWGAIIVVGMILIGPSRAAVAIRRVTAPVFNLDIVAFWTGAAIVYLVILLWSPSPALRPWWSVLLIAAVVGGGLEYLRRRAAVEFPDRRFGNDLSELRESGQRMWGNVTGWFGSHRGHDDSSSSDDHVAQLQKLSTLHDTGSLSDEEFAAAKRKLLG